MALMSNYLTINLLHYYLMMMLLVLGHIKSIPMITESSHIINSSVEDNNQILMTTQTTFSTDFVTSDIDLTPVQGWRCHCWNSTENQVPELECHCEGSLLLRIPQRLHFGMQRLTIASAGLKILRTTGLKAYGPHLKDIMFSDLKDFDTIQRDAFSTLKILRTIYISKAPKLQHLSPDCFNGISNTLKSLRIINCGLMEVPNLRLLSPSTILHMVDLEGNQITKIDSKSVRIKTEELILNNNALAYIDDSAFYGSEIAKLSLKSNNKLHLLHKSAFSGIANIVELDLSSTFLEELPTEGLQTLEILRIQNTHSLKTIPSVYNFKNLREAWLTHSFHCCAFKFPSRHDPIRHAQRLEHLTKLQRTCINNGFLSSQTIEDKGDIENRINVNEQHESISTNFNHSINKRSLSRRKRWFDNFTEASDSYSSNTINQNSESTKDNIANRGKISWENNKNMTMREELHPITGSPLSNVEIPNKENLPLLFNPNDGGFFHETEILTSNSLEAICGNLTTNVIDVKCYPIPDALNPCEDVMGSNWLRGSVWVVVLLAVVGNVAVLIVLFSNRSDVTVPKFLMSNLAIADLCMGLYLLLVASIDAHSIGEYFNVAYDWQYGSGCKAAGFLTVFASHLSIFTLTIITLERWFAITHAIYLNKRIKLKAATHIMIVGWIYSIVMASLPLFGISNYSSTSICLPMEARDSLDVAYIISVLAINGLAFFVILVCYAQIYLSLGKETRQAARNVSRGEMTVAKKMALLVFTNFACWAPIAFFGLTAIAGFPLIDVAKSKILLVFFYPLNSCANPYLYAILTAQYRRDLFLLLSKYGFCTQRAQQYKLTYSLPTTNHTYPLSLIGRNSYSGQRKSSRGNNQDEAFV